MTPPPDAPTAVIALGGNALAPAGEKSTIYDQFRHTRESLGPIVELARARLERVRRARQRTAGRRRAGPQRGRARGGEPAPARRARRRDGGMDRLHDPAVARERAAARGLDARGRHGHHAGAGRAPTIRRCSSRRSSSGRRSRPSAPTSCDAEGHVVKVTDGATCAGSSAVRCRRRSAS